MPQVGWKCVNTKEDLSYDTCLACSRQGGQPRGRCDFTPEILLGIKQNLYSKTRERILESKTVSISTMIGEIRQRVLELFRDFYVSPAKNYWAFRGSMGHAIVDATKRSDAWHELAYQRPLVKPIDGEVWAASGRSDVMIPSAKTILDYKSCRAVPKYDKPYGSHPDQLNAYRWLFEPIFLAEKLRVVYFDMDKPKRVSINIEDVDEVGERLWKAAVEYVTAVKKGICPEGAYSSKNWRCRYCDVTDACKSVKTGDKL